MDSRDQYKLDRIEQMQQNRLNKKLRHAVEQFTPHLVRSNYVKNFTWWGIPIIQYPTDLMVIQELIFEIKPKHVIETGMAFGGSTVFYTAVCGPGVVISIDIDPAWGDSKVSHETICLNPEVIHYLDNVYTVKGSSIDKDLVSVIAGLFFLQGGPNLVILDSSHTAEHVYQELKLYSPFVSIGSYIVVMDTAIEFYGHLDKNQDRPWGKGNNPWTAVQQFMSEQDDFVIDKEVEQRALITGAIDGWLKRIK